MAQKQAPHPRRKGSVVWATVLSWLSSLLLALLALCLVLMTTICSASYMKEQVNRSDFSEAAYSYLYDNFISYGASSGFSADVMTAALSRDQITADMEDSITRLYQGDTAIDTRNAILNTTYDNLINAEQPRRRGHIRRGIRRRRRRRRLSSGLRQLCHGTPGQPAVYFY